MRQKVEKRVREETERMQAEKEQEMQEIVSRLTEENLAIYEENKEKEDGRIKQLEKEKGRLKEAMEEMRERLEREGRAEREEEERKREREE